MYFAFLFSFRIFQFTISWPSALINILQMFLQEFSKFAQIWLGFEDFPIRPVETNYLKKTQAWPGFDPWPYDTGVANSLTEQLSQVKVGLFVKDQL